MRLVDELLADCHFPPAQSAVDLAVSGGPDSMGLLLLAREAQLEVTVHHVDHHARARSDADARFVAQYCAREHVAFVGHDVVVAPGPNFEARARAARREVLPAQCLTGHTMDDLVETMVLNMLRGAGVDGLSALVDDPTKPLVDLRRARLHEFVRDAGVEACHDPTNDSPDFRRNRVRHELVPLMNDVAQRDVTPVLARSARVMRDERAWLDELSVRDVDRSLTTVDCRELVTWPRARLRRWLRAQLVLDDGHGELYPPTLSEVARAIDVVVGRANATQLNGGRRLARTSQRLRLEGGSTTLTNHG